MQAQSNHPVWYNQAVDVVKTDINNYDRIINKMSSALITDVCWRFLYVSQKTYEVYKLDKERKEIAIGIKNIPTLEEFGFIIVQLLNYKWSQLLEKFNRAPKISTKVNNSHLGQINRSNLKKYKEILLQEFREREPIDFYTGLVLEENEITVDHVIPWSFIYSDDIWNLVLTSKSYNSSKSNSVPSKDILDKLKLRNQKFISIFSDDKLREELKRSIEHNYLLRYYLDLIS